MGIFGWLQRRLARRHPLEPAWREILREKVPFYRALSDRARARFEDKLNVFVRTKSFVAAGGMVIDDRVRVLIGAGAARLSMNLPGEDFEHLAEVIVYPSHFIQPGKPNPVFGQASRGGTVVLSYDAVLSGLNNAGDGHDTGLHEFAHVLDAEDGAFDGTPTLHQLQAYAPWANVMSKEFQQLRSRGGRRNVLRSYGALNEAEFFAVATEAFFEKPHTLKRKHPDLYQALAGFYRSDPAAE